MSPMLEDSLAQNPLKTFHLPEHMRKLKLKLEVEVEESGVLLQLPSTLLRPGQLRAAQPADAHIRPLHLYDARRVVHRVCAGLLAYYPGLSIAPD